jgi:acyl-CoA hydrolase
MRISDTMTEVVRLVAPHNANPLGFLYGGYMLNWLVDTGTIAAMDFVRADLVLGFLDRMHFVSPVRIGDVLVYRAWVVNSGNSSLSILVESYVKEPSDVKLATVGRLIFVRVGENGVPERLGIGLDRGDGWEAALYDEFSAWRRSVEPALRRDEARTNLSPLSRLLSMPEDATATGIMYGGRLLYYLDQFNGITAFNFSPRIYVTASVNATAFRRPIRIGDVVEVRTGITYVGTTSLEVAFDVHARSPSGARHVAGGYSTFVSMGGDGRPAPIGVPGFGDEEAIGRKEEGLRDARILRSLRPRLELRRPALVDALAGAR